MIRQLVPTVLLLILTLQLPSVTGARAIEPDPTAFLPPNATVRQTVHGDVDGDGRADTVALYALARPVASETPRAGLLVLLDSDAGARPIHLFGQPPSDMRGEPALDTDGSSELSLQDLAGDGRKLIVLTVTNQFPTAAPRTLVWIFGPGETPQPTDDEIGPSPPTWAGTGFRAEAFLEGDTVEIVPADAGRPSTLRRRLDERMIGGPDAVLSLSEIWRWRGDGIRLAERTLTLPNTSAGSARSPEAAVLSYYGALARGDTPAAAGLLGDTMRAAGLPTLTGDASAPAQDVRVEEVRLLDSFLTRQASPASERLAYVRVSWSDPRNRPSAADAPAQRHTLAGTWQTQQVGDQWQLVAADLHQAADLAAIADAMPGGVSIAETAGGDVRGLGVEDVAVLMSPPGRFTLVQPYILFAGPNGLEPGVPLASYMKHGLVGGPFGTIRVEDVNADGVPEVTFSGIAGAHSALLWVLRWDGSTLVPLFEDVSNAPVIGLEDLDGDGVAEIMMVQSGYCGSYASSPVQAFAFRWEDGVYRAASWRYPSLHDGIDDRAEEATSRQPDDPSLNGERACVQHMLALANAFRGRAAETRTAYRAYANFRQRTPADSRLFLKPIYLGAEYVEADLRAILTAAESGASPGWTPADRAVLHDLLGDALLSRAQNHRYAAESAAKQGKTELEQEARRIAEAAREAAMLEYQAALALDPTDEEARRALGE